MNRREFLKLLGMATMGMAAAATMFTEGNNELDSQVITDGDSYVVTGIDSTIEDFDGAMWSMPLPPVKWEWEYSSPGICPECSRPADHCWCGGECIGQFCIMWGWDNAGTINLERSSIETQT